MTPRLLIWWLCEEDYDFIGEPRETWPEWLRLAYGRRLGRAGRGRLWVAEHFGEVRIDPLTAAWGTPLGRICNMYGGIVITERETMLLGDLPGIVTTLDLRRPEFGGLGS